MVGDHLQDKDYGSVRAADSGGRALTPLPVMQAGLRKRSPASASPWTLGKAMPLPEPQASSHMSKLPSMYTVKSVIISSAVDLG